MDESQDSPKEPENAEWKLNYESAMRAHDRKNDIFDISQKAVIEYGIIAIRSAVLIAGGSVVVGLGFISSLYNDDPELGTRLMLPVVVFAIAVITAGSATGFSYLAQLYYTKTIDEWTMHFENPVIRESEISKTRLFWGNVWQTSAIVFVIMSYLLILSGILIAAYVLNFPMDSNHLG